MNKTRLTLLYEWREGFWLPVTHHTDVQVRLFGSGVLDILYQSLRRDSGAAGASGPIRGRALKLLILEYFVR